MDADTLLSILSGLGIAVTLCGLAFGPAFVACLWERQLVWPYADPDDPDFPPGPETAAAAESNAALAVADFRFVATLGDPRGTGYRLRFDNWLSADGRTLATVVCGRLFVFKLNSVRLTTLAADGTALLTTNKDYSCEIDLAGLRRDVLLTNAAVPLLLARHRDRLAAGESEPVPFSEADPLADYADFLRRKLDGLMARGYAQFLDDEQTEWRYSIWGSMHFAVRGVLRSLWMGLRQPKIPR